MWTIVNTPADWVAYQLKTAKELQLLPERIKWGEAPQDYPCMVSTLMPPRPAGTEPKVYSAFVYMADCEELFAAGGRKFVDPDAPVLPNQSQFNRWVAAELLTVAHFLTETGICRQAGFEEKLLEMLTTVDEYHSGNKEELRKRLASYDAKGLDMLEQRK